LLPGHDGIHEYDNPIPAWMSSILGLTIAFGVVYMLYQHAGDGPTLQQDYDAALAENVRIQFAEIGTLKPDEPTILDYMGKPDWLAFGKTVYLTHCQSCHGPAALGNVGPNLCDDSWKHVEKLADIAKVVANGAAGAAMPAWGNRLHANEIVLVSAYVAALRGSGGGAGKAADGKPIPPWPAPPTAGGAQQGGKP
jgi:cytochrome c oxidase cbb3-type subunit 3